MHAPPALEYCSLEEHPALAKTQLSRFAHLNRLLSSQSTTNNYEKFSKNSWKKAWLVIQARRILMWILHNHRALSLFDNRGKSYTEKSCFIPKHATPENLPTKYQKNRSKDTWKPEIQRELTHTLTGKIVHTFLVLMCCLNSSIVVLESVISLNIPSSFEVNRLPHSV